MSLDLQWSQDGRRCMPTPEDARIQEQMVRRVMRWCIDTDNKANALRAVKNACLDYLVYPPSTPAMANIAQERQRANERRDEARRHGAYHLPRSKS